MQLYVEREVIWRRRAPAFHHSRLRHGIKCRVHLDHFEMLRIPSKSFASRHPFRIPTLDKPGVRPTGCADEDFSGFCGSFGHASTNSRPSANANEIATSPRFYRMNTFSICTTSISKLSSKCGVEQPGSSSGS